MSDVLKIYQQTHMNEIESLGALFRANLLYAAARSGKTKDLQELIEQVEYCADVLHSAIGFAANLGQKDCVLILLPHCDPTYDNSKILLACAKHNWHDLLDDLWDVCDPLDLLNSIASDTSDAKHLIEAKWRAQQEKQIIEHQLSGSHPYASRKKI